MPAVGNVAAKDTVFADLLASAGGNAAASMVWSSFAAAEFSPNDTLRAAFSSHLAPPTMATKTVSPLGDDDPGADYALLGRLGEGGMGVVFEARQSHLARNVALKMIRPELANDPGARNCFFYEALVTAGLEHPGIVPVLEFGVAQDGRAFYTMKKATGVPWSRVIRERTEQENLALFERVADVVAYAHSRGVIHRDLKPGNVLLGSFGELWLSDWGVALKADAGGGYGHAFPGGTPQYMAPEMARHEPGMIGRASDIYLLGAMLFEILTGKPPHAGGTIAEVLANAANNYIAPSSRRHALMAVAYKAMAEEPNSRFADVLGMQEAIRACLAETEGMTILRRADAQLAEAERRGGYEQYQLAITDYTAAVEALPESQDARNGKSGALLAYSRQALKNSEYDLALSIIESELPHNRHAVSLAQTISLEQKRARRRPRRLALANTAIGLLAFALLLAGAYVIFNWGSLTYNTYRTRDKSDSYFYRDIHKESTYLVGFLSGMETHNGLLGHPEIVEKIRTARIVLQNCTDNFVDPETATPSAIRQACNNLYARIDEIDALFKDIETLSSQLPEGPAKRSLGSVNVYYGRLLKILHAYRAYESR